MGVWNIFSKIFTPRSVTRNGFIGPKTAALAQTIARQSFDFLGLLEEDLTSSFPKDGEEYLHKRLNVFFEAVSFFAHIASRIVFQRFGPSKRQQLNDKIGPLLVDCTISHFYENTSQESQAGALDKFRQNFFDFLNTSEREYALCKAMVLKQDEDVSYANKIVSGEKSKGVINLMTDSIFHILEDCNPVTYERIMAKLLSMMKPEEFTKIAVEAAKEI